MHRHHDQADNNQRHDGDDFDHRKPELPSEAAELGFTIEDYDYHTMPQIVDGKMEIYLHTDAMEQQGIIFQSADHGVTWEYAGCKG